MAFIENKKGPPLILATTGDGEGFALLLGGGVGLGFDKRAGVKLAAEILLLSMLRDDELDEVLGDGDYSRDNLLAALGGIRKPKTGGA